MKTGYFNCRTAITTRVHQTGIVYESDLIHDLADEYKKNYHQKIR